MCVWEMLLETETGRKKNAVHITIQGTFLETAKRPTPRHEKSPCEKGTKDCSL